MANTRKYFRYGINELYAEFTDNTSNIQVLEDLKNELSFRKTAAAKNLEKKVLEAISGRHPAITNNSNDKSQTNGTSASKLIYEKTVPKTNGFLLTDEQNAAIQFFSTNQSLKVNAFAGAGKTSTLVEMAKSTNRSGLYLAFNKSIAQDASAKFPNRIECRTTHSLAYRNISRSFSGDTAKLTNSLNVNAVNQHLNLEPLYFDSQKIPAKIFAGLVLRTLNKFLHSAEESIVIHHIPRPSGPIGMLSEVHSNQLKCAVLEKTHILWNQMKDPYSPIPLGHDGYLKLWALSKPTLTADFILLDEAQDSNPVVLGVLGEQSSQIIYVGDRHQQIYEWRGAVNAMEKIETVNSSLLTQSFRFGQPIAETAQLVLNKLGEKQKIQGNQRINSTIGSFNADAILCRTNFKLIEELLGQLNSNKSVAVVGGTRELLNLLYGVRDLQNNTPTDAPELFGFSNWDEVIDFSKTEDGASLLTLVNLVSKLGLGALFTALKSCEQDENSAKTIIGTTHKVKGREWNSVRLADDYVTVRKDKEGEEQPISKEELRILYVALTRAKKELTYSENVEKFLFNGSSYRMRKYSSLYEQRETIFPSKPKDSFKTNTMSSTQPFQSPQQEKPKKQDGVLFSLIKNFFGV